ncbi:GIY-YIG nuclease family protein [Prochlorothrix hollandica]|uniref:Nuclease subunit of the excinuclease complex n=1 Tax=Prochlorothrix hollandica PCC 9006 = CALU 1027 TaxID=317619 RepID=A0A0M2Q2G3_PROHO|nr:GIY-YIG nuclease family protein [Prochlorothrix hollandica]KKJ01164.1 Nuclease subunit of the excinuclease complex [Prochlorothrix hollandica PCC 9006 = CALU 1027]
MTAPYPSLQSLDFIPYVDSEGVIPEDLFQGKVGVYGIFDADQSLCYVGLSRDIYASLRQHLVRRPHQCHWLKFQTLDRPNRTVLEGTRQQWIDENGAVPLGNGAEEAHWTQAIDAKAQMTPEEQAAVAAADDLGRSNLLRDVSRRVEAEIFAILAARGVTLKFRFDPKLKEQGLLNLKA